MRKLLIVLLAVAMFALASCGNVFTAAAAVVNGARISSDIVEKETTSALASPQAAQFVGQEPNARALVARRVLEGFIIRAVQRKAAARLGIRITKAQVDKQIADLVESLSQARIDETVRQQGWTHREFLEQVQDLAMTQALFAKLAPVSDARVRKEYAANKSQLTEARFSDILISTEARSPAKALARAKAAKARIAAGESFAAVARAMSDDPTTKATGGAHDGFVLVSTLDTTDPGEGGVGPGLGSAVARAPIRKVSAPVRTATGYHLLLVAARRTQPFEQAADDIRQRLQQSLGQAAVDKLVRAELAKAKIVVNPRYGDWDPEQATIVEHHFFEPPAVDGNAPPTGTVVETAPVAPAGG